MSETVLQTATRSNGAGPSLATGSEPRHLRAIPAGNGATLERSVPLLEQDRGLMGAVPDEHVPKLWQLLRADVIELQPGSWEPETVPLDQNGAMGLLVLDGFLTRSQALGARSSAELLGPGDLMRPWDWYGQDNICVEAETSWRVSETARVALLDRRISAVVGRSPALTAELMSRLVRSSRMLAMLLALTQVRQLKKRILLALWTLAERWGRVTPEGVALTLPLTHATLAQLAGASRPSVTSAVAELSAEGVLTRLGNHGWLLMGESPLEN